MNMMMLAVVIALLSSAHGATDNFRLGVQLSDHGPGENAGAWSYTPYLQGADDVFSGYAGDSNYYGPDYLRLSLQTDAPGPLAIDGLDFRLKIQANDGSASNPGGDIGYTSWASEAAGWSADVLPFDNSGLDGVRVGIETRVVAGLTLTDVQVGIRMLDSTDTTASESERQDIIGPIGDASAELITQWVFANVNTHPDSVAIYLSATSTVDPCVSLNLDFEIDEVLQCSGTYSEGAAAISALQEKVESNRRRISRLANDADDMGGVAAMQAPWVQDPAVFGHTVGNRDWMLIVSMFVNVLAVTVSILLGCQLYQARRGYKVANYESEDVH